MGFHTGYIHIKKSMILSAGKIIHVHVTMIYTQPVEGMLSMSKVCSQPVEDTQPVER